MSRWSKFYFSLLALVIAGAVEARDATKGSLWGGSTRASERSMFADARATSRGDIVTIIVGESASMTTSVQLTTSKESSISNDFSRILFNEILRRDGEHPSTDIRIGPNTHDAGGSSDASRMLSTRISVQVIDVLPNGNLVLEGVRVISYANETYFMLTQGICRARDIGPDNTIHSSEIADARIEVIAEGVLTDAQKQGWLSRAANRYSP